jgi:hypothetical protein
MLKNRTILIFLSGLIFTFSHVSYAGVSEDVINFIRNNPQLNDIQIRQGLYGIAFGPEAAELFGENPGHTSISQFSREISRIQSSAKSYIALIEEKPWSNPDPVYKDDIAMTIRNARYRNIDFAADLARHRAHHGTHGRGLRRFSISGVVGGLVAAGAGFGRGQEAHAETDECQDCHISYEEAADLAPASP